MKNLFTANYNDLSGLITRLSVGLVLFPHGAQKMLGWWGGYGFSGTMEYFTESLSLPRFIALLVIVIEFFGALSLIAGLAGRLWSFLVIVLFIGIILTSHLQFGFFMNWFGSQQGEGFEYDLLMIGLATSTLVTGSGMYSLDKLMAKQTEAERIKLISKLETATSKD